MPSLLHPTLRDISPQLDADKLKNTGRMVQEEFTPDAESCSEWREMHAKWIEIYFQRDKTEKPFDGASQDTLPILAEACDQFHARASKAMFPARGRKMIRCVPTGSWDALAAERAERVEKHLQWQLLDSSSQYRKSKDAMLIGLPLHGTVFTKTYFDPFYMASRTENVRATDMIVPYGTGPRTIENLPRNTQHVWHPAHYARRLTAQGYYNQELSAFKDRGN